MKLNIKKISENAVIPTRAHHDDAGIDMYANGQQIVLPHQTAKISSGIAMEIEEGYVGLIWDKSSVGSKGMKVMCGVIDAGYRGEVLIMMHNLTDTPYIFEHGHKVAQMLIQKVEFPVIEEVDTLNDTARGEGKFGSTGK
jgi:dUTP pyrophosphatase